jgi:hypothetical protein
MLNTTIMTTLATVIFVALAMPAEAAKTKRSSKVRGALCYHFSQSVFVPISQFKPSTARGMRVGQTIRFNYPDIGEIRCKVQ